MNKKTAIFFSFLKHDWFFLTCFNHFYQSLVQVDVAWSIKYIAFISLHQNFLLTFSYFSSIWVIKSVEVFCHKRKSVTENILQLLPAIPQNQQKIVPKLCCWRVLQIVLLLHFLMAKVTILREIKTRQIFFFLSCFLSLICAVGLPENIHIGSHRFHELLMLSF